MVYRNDLWQVLTLACGFAIGFIGPLAAEAMPPGDRVVKERIFNQQGLVQAVVWRRQSGSSGLLVDRGLSVPAPARMMFSNAGPADGARVRRGVDGMTGSWRSEPFIKVAAKTSREKGNAAVAPTAKQSAATPSVKGEAKIGGVSAAQKKSANSDKNDKKAAQPSTSQQKTSSSGRDTEKTAQPATGAKKGTKAAGTEEKSEQAAADTKTTGRSAKDSKRVARTSEEARKGTKAAGTEEKSEQAAADREQTAQSADDSETAAQASWSSKQEEARRVSIESVSPLQRGIGQTGNPLPVIGSVSPPQQTADNRAALATGQQNRLFEMNSRNFQPPLTGERVARSSFENRNNPHSSAFIESIKAPEPPMTAMYVPREMPGRISQQQSIPQPIAPRSPAPIFRGSGGSVQVFGPMIFQYTDSGRVVGCSVRNIRLDYGWCATFVSAKGTDNCKVILRGDSKVLSVGCT